MLRLFAGTYSLRQWVVIVVTAALFIGLGFLWLDPQQRGYVGASGVLHGVLAAGMVRWWRTEQRFDAVLLTLILVGKLVWEQSQGSLPLSGAMPVAIDAHLYGAVGGFCSAGCLEWLAYRRREQSSRAPL
jgi:membrane associated rhomboid family serine protease